MIITSNSDVGDAITGEPIFKGERILDTGIVNIRTFEMNESINRIVKEETIVWLAEQAGYTLTKRDAGDSGDTEVVDESNAGVGGGESPTGEAPVRGSKAAKRRSSGTTKG